MALRPPVLGAVLAAAVAAGAGAASARPNPPSVPVGKLVEGIRCAGDPSQTYTLFLPVETAAGQRRPMLLVFDPRGRSLDAARLFVGAAEELGWMIMSSNDTRSDGPMEPNVKALNAMFPDAVDRYPTDPDRIYAAGFSGGAMLSWMLARQTGRIAGVIAAGGRWIPDVFDGEVTWACFGAVGATDFNYAEMHRVDALLAGAGAEHRLEVFPGPHAWMPEPLARHGVEWLELIAMKRGLRERDDALVARLYEEDAGEARLLEAAGDRLGAMRRWQAVARTFAGLREVEGAGRRAEALAKDTEVKRALKEERHCEGLESRSLDRIGRVLGELQQGERPMPPARLASQLGLADLQRRLREAGGCEASTAERLLETVFTQTAFYLARDFLAAGRYHELASVLTVAASIRGDRPIVWYNLACARARTGEADAAMAALESAVAHGWGDADQTLADADLASLRQRADFQALIARLRS